MTLLGPEVTHRWQGHTLVDHNGQPLESIEVIYLDKVVNQPELLEVVVDPIDDRDLDRGEIAVAATCGRRRLVTALRHAACVGPKGPQCLRRTPCTASPTSPTLTRP
jgi:hypothetical protein